MEGRASARVALIVAALTGAGLVAAAPVPVLSISDGTREVLARLEPGEPLVYSYRQSIYQVTVYEDLARTDEGIAIRRARSSDPRAVEYFGWGGEPRAGADGLWSEGAPRSVPPNSQLVIRITPAGEQSLGTARWRIALRPQFGETVVRVRAEERPWLLAALGGAR